MRWRRRRRRRRKKFKRVLRGKNDGCGFGCFLLDGEVGGLNGGRRANFGGAWEEENGWRGGSSDGGNGSGDGGGD